MLKEIYTKKLKKIIPSRTSDKILDVEEAPPLILLTSENYSKIKDWEVGGIYRLSLEVKQKSKNERENSVVRSEFEILKIEGEEKKEDNKKEIKSKYLS